MGLMYVAIRVKDLDVSVDFYTKQMGLTVVGKRSPIPGEEIVTLEDDESKQRINLMWYAETCKLYTPWKEDGVELDHIMFSVKDAKKAYQDLITKGAPAAMDLYEGNGIVMGLVKDPNGIWVGVRSEAKK